MNGFSKHLLELAMDRGLLSSINYGHVPVHDNPQLPTGNKGIHWETGLLLANFVEQVRPRVTVELGSFRGYSTSWLIAANEHQEKPGAVHAYDVFKEGYYCPDGKMHYQALGLPLNHFCFHYVPGGIWDYPVEVPEMIDLVFHDTQHLLNPTVREMDLLLPRMSAHGVILVDDMLHPEYRAMQEYLKGFFDEKGWDFKILPIGTGLGVAQRGNQ